jgi:branched-chain amino acid transport system permease protein
VVLLMTFVGGIGFFYGPIIGAILITVMQIVIGGMTHAWLLYFGLFFLFMVLMAPGGIASVIAVQRNLWQAGLFGRMLPHYLATALPVLILLAGLVGLVELGYALLAGEGVGAGDDGDEGDGHAIAARGPPAPGSPRSPSPPPAWR